MDEATDEDEFHCEDLLHLSTMSLSLYSELILEDDGLLPVEDDELDETLSLLLILSSDLSRGGPCNGQSLKV